MSLGLNILLRSWSIWAVKEEVPKLEELQKESIECFIDD